MKVLVFLSLLTMSVFASSVDAKPDVDLSMSNDTVCLALNLYHEARSERTAGMWAVGDVTINRVKSSSFPNTICGVVTQGPKRESWKTVRFPDIPDEQRIYYPIRGKCQFSWWCDGKTDLPTEIDSWYRALDIARLMIENEVGLGLTDGADHYHADYIDPFWNDSMVLITKIGNHKFYKDIR